MLSFITLYLGLIPWLWICTLKTSHYNKAYSQDKPLL